MKNLKNVTYTAVFAALICAATMVIKYDGTGGYYHAGDSFIYLAAVCLPFPYAPIAGALGGSLADLFSGYAIYILPTFIIKFLIALSFTNKTQDILCKRNFLALFIGGTITVTGYYVAELIIQKGNLVVAAATIYGNIAQAAVSSAIFVALAYSVPKLREMLFRYNIYNQ